ARSSGAVLVFEGAAPGGALKVERKGVASYRIRVAGRSAHAGLEPELGANALLGAAVVAQYAADLTDTGAGTTVTPTMLSAGVTRNTVPETADLWLDARASS